MLPRREKPPRAVPGLIEPDRIAIPEGKDRWGRPALQGPGGEDPMEMVRLAAGISADLARKLRRDLEERRGEEGATAARPEETAADRGLRERIEEEGLGRPVVVVPEGEGRWRLLDGSRRLGAWKSSERLADRPIPAVVAPEGSAPGQAEGFLRSLEPLECAFLADACTAHAARPGAAIGGLAAAFGVRPQRLWNLLRVFRCEPLKARVEGRKLTLGAAVALAALPPKELEERLASLAGEHRRLSVREVEKRVAEWTGRALAARACVPAGAENAAAFVRRMLQATWEEDMEATVRWSAKARRPALTLVLPYHPDRKEDVAAAIREAEATTPKGNRGK